MKYNNKDQDFELDEICDFKFYFHRNNPSNLIEEPLNRYIVPIMIDRFRSYWKAGKYYKTVKSNNMSILSFEEQV